MRPAWVAAAVGLGVLCLMAQTPGNSAHSGPSDGFFAGPGSHGAFLNGEPLLPGTAILPGETVTTTGGGVLVLAATGADGGVLELTGDASATVGGGEGQLRLNQGNALVTGDVTVSTPQGEVFRPSSRQASYVVNAGTQQSSMGVLAGTVNTFGPGGRASTVRAGNAIQVAGGNGGFRVEAVNPSRVSQPQPTASVPQIIPASQSR